MIKGVFIALAGLGTLWLLLDSRSGSRLSRWSANLEVRPSLHRRLASALIAAWTAFLCVLKIEQHVLLQTGFDLAIYANVAWHMIHGPIFYDAIFDRNILSGHFSPIYLVLGLIYRLYQHPATLMVVQSIGLGLGAVALYRIAVRRLGRSLWALGMLLLYCSHSYLHIAHAKDFHTSVLAVPVLLWMLEFAESGRPTVVLLCGALALTIEEGVPIAVAGAGLYLAAFCPRLRLAGWLCALIAAAYFLTVAGMVIPSLYKSGGHLLWDRYAHLGSSLKDALINLVTRPIWFLDQALVVHDKFFYVLAFFGSIGFLPFLAWRELLLTVPPLLAMVVSQNPGQYKLGFHYSAMALPFLYYASVCGARTLQTKISRLPVRAEFRLRLAAMFIAALVGFNISQVPNYDLTKVDHAYVAAAREVLSGIPPEVSVAATGALVPQLVNRHLVCYVQWEPGRLCTWGAPEFVVLDLADGRSSDIPLSVRRQYLSSLVDGLGYTVIERQDGIITLQGPERLGTQFAPSPSARTF